MNARRLFRTHDIETWRSGHPGVVETAPAAVPGEFRKPIKVVIQIPCRDEAEQLPETLAALPAFLHGVHEVEWLVIDDGSSDDTTEVALEHGVHAVLRLPENRGLANAFSIGLEAACRRGADIIVNVDGDNQYDAAAIPALVADILAGRADIVVGCRPIERIAHFPWWKKRLQRLGSAVVRAVSNVRIDDATSGFRAYSRDAAMRLNVYSRYTYTLETLIQAGQTGLRIKSVPVEVNPPTRPSRLIRSVPEYIARSVLTILRSFLIYRPLEFFMLPSVLCALLGISIGAKFTFDYFYGQGDGHIQSLILAAMLVMVGTIGGAVGLLANQLAVNRRLLEEQQQSRRRAEWRPMP
ncbi:glycosyltransferase family 2 protein [Lysobacter gummosus]|jgi:glycosyltransferase involved in cell wall biosynthesis|uniref:Glycosyltransferase family 2 protein n=1 Tax=Lysobacter gummosus TaxID=262324 RepID=A0ABY3X621_9GAMM|nr:glycosyltransferase family 2 protein [Lysobacter gummosus]ALN92436.1 glycosyl transferase 2 family protein [Lysobacter gummosus]UNP28018.1 glycosyltransferase family 2 protein [Lysobacter gummosus]